MIHVDIISDTVCPWCYIGKRRFEQAVALRPNYQFQIGWRPFQLNPEMAHAGMPRGEYLKAKFGGVDRAARVYETVSSAGEEVGLAFDFSNIPRQPNTFDSHRLVRWSESAGLQDAVVEALFRGYFIEEVDVNDQSALVEIAHACGMDGKLVRELFARDADRDLVMAEEGVARRMGINGVPCFVIDHKYAISGAQEPSVLTHVFDLALQDKARQGKVQSGLGEKKAADALQAAEDAD